MHQKFELDLTEAQTIVATVLEKALFSRGAKHALKGWTMDQMKEYSDSILERRGFTFYDAYWTGVDSILDVEVV